MQGNVKPSGARLKRVAIVTLQGNYNYGNRLQNFAVSEIYRHFGYEPVSLMHASIKTEAKGLVKRVLGRAPESSMDAGRRKGFARFNSRMSFKTISKLSDRMVEEFDLFSVGSDQVWNVFSNKADIAWRFLDGVPSGKKVALAPSFGEDRVPEELKERVGRYLSSFTSVSIREKAGQRLLRDTFGIEATVLCDPTLAVPRDLWESVSQSEFPCEDPYIFIYVLGDDPQQLARVLELVDASGNYRVVMLSDRARTGEVSVGPSGFISLIQHARHVVTDSYHAAVFSCIFETPLTVIERAGRPEMFSRMETLAVLLGIQGKFYGHSAFDLALSSDYEGVAEAIERERCRFYEYLNGCING